MRPLDRDLGIYLELARSYRAGEPYRRRSPDCFSVFATCQGLQAQFTS